MKGDLKGLDSELDATFEKLLDQWKSMEFSLERTELIGAQRAWILYREKTCSFEQSVHGGTLSISFLRCMSRVTKERVDYLKELLYRGAGMLGPAHAVERTLSGRVRLPTGSAHACHQAPWRRPPFSPHPPYFRPLSLPGSFDNDQALDTSASG